MTHPIDKPPDGDPHAHLERAFMDEYLRTRGHSLATLHNLPAEQVKTLMEQASLYASARLTEVEARAHLVDDLHRGGPPAAEKSRGKG
jgi:hypothetical protein